MPPPNQITTAHALQQIFADAADPERALGMVAYMKELFPFFGIQTPQRRLLTRPWLAAIGRTPEAQDLLGIAESLWKCPQRECQYAAVDMLVKHAKRFKPQHEGRLAALICKKSWWDTVDLLAAHVYGKLAQDSEAVRRTLDGYAEHENLWLRRVAILYQLHYAEQTDLERLTTILEANLDHPDFFIRKAMGWALRQYARTDADWVKRWLQAHGDAVPALTRREAGKHL